MLSKLLSYWLIETVAIGTSTQPLFLIDPESFDQYLLDSLLADLNDWEFCCLICNGGPDTPILFFSGVLRMTLIRRETLRRVRRSLCQSVRGAFSSPSD